MTPVDPRPGARRSGRSGRVFDRVLDALSEIDAGKPADLAVRHVEARARDLGANERRELRELVFGLLRARRRVRDALARAASAERKRLEELEPPLRLRLEVLAHRAETDRSVAALDALDPKVHRRFAKILGRIAADRLPKKRTGDPDAIRYNFPDWLWTKLVDGLGAEAAHTVAAALASRAPVTVRVRGGDVEGARRDLAAEGVEARPTASSPVGLHLPAGTDLRASALFKAGRIELQDEGSQLLGLAAALPARGGAVLDACAGAGGKTLQLLETAGRVVALEPDEAKRKELRRRLERAGASAQIEAEELEAHAERTPDRFDVVLIDAPCTGTGTLRRHPEIALRLTPADLEREVARQKRLVAAGLRCLKPGGRLVYATCSVLREENEAIVEYARVEGGGVQPAPVFTGELGERLSRVSALRIGPEPGNGPDGFFVAALTLD